jgi:hypothetical protein
MKFLITVVIVVGLGLGVWQVCKFWEKTQQEQRAAVAPAPAVVSSGDQLPGLPPRLQAALEAAQQRGAAGLRDFLAANGKNVADPRLAWIQLDYVLVVAQSDPAEARKVFAQVKQRLKPDSPVYSRMKQLEKTYE